MRSGSNRWLMLVIAAACCAPVLSLSAQAVTAHWNGDRLQMSSPGLHFLGGRALDRLHNGASVPYNFQLTLTTIPRSYALERALDRFVVSYDLWEEKFSVVEARGMRKSATHLTASAAEAWCIAEMSVPASGVAPDKDLWLRIEIRAEDPSQQSPLTDSGLSLTSLIELFSRPARNNAQEWSAETGPFRLRDLKR